MNIFDKIKAFFDSIDQIQRSKAAELYELEEKELRNVFSLMVFGSFVGLPTAPVHITSDLFPEMEKELEFMLNKVASANDPLGELFSTLDVA